MRCFVPILGLAIVLLPAQGQAQDREAARAAFDRGEANYEAENFQLALEEYQRSSDLMEGDERAQLLLRFNIARCQEELGQLCEAMQGYEQYLLGARDDDPFLAETRSRIAELRARDVCGGNAVTSEQTISPVGPVIAGAAVIAGTVVGILSLDRASELDSMCVDGVCPDTQDARDLESEMLTLSNLADGRWIGGPLWLPSDWCSRSPSSTRDLS